MPPKSPLTYIRSIGEEVAYAPVLTCPYRVDEPAAKVGHERMRQDFVVVIHMLIEDRSGSGNARHQPQHCRYGHGRRNAVTHSATLGDYV